MGRQPATVSVNAPPGAFFLPGNSASIHFHSHFHYRPADGREGGEGGCNRSRLGGRLCGSAIRRNGAPALLTEGVLVL